MSVSWFYGRKIKQETAFQTTENLCFNIQISIFDSVSCADQNFYLYINKPQKKSLQLSCIEKENARIIDIICFQLNFQTYNQIFSPGTKICRNLVYHIFGTQTTYIIFTAQSVNSQAALAPDDRFFLTVELIKFVSGTPCSWRPRVSTAGR